MTEPFKYAFVLILAVSLIYLGVTSLKRKSVGIGFGGRAAARPLFTVTLNQRSASVYGIICLVGGIILLIVEAVAAFSGVVRADIILSIAVGATFVTIVGGFVFATIIQLAINTGEALAASKKDRSD